MSPRPATGWNAQKAETAPLAVPDLAIAAQLLGQPLDRVRDVAQGLGHPHPYEATNGTKFYSLHALAVGLGLVQVKAREPSGRPTRAPRVKLTRGDAEAAAVLAETTQVYLVAKSYHVGVKTMVRTWAHYGIRNPRARKPA